MHIVVCYLAYLAISRIVAVRVARTIARNGRAFLIDAFHANCELADSVNHLLIVRDAPRRLSLPLHCPLLRAEVNQVGRQA